MNGTITADSLAFWTGMGRTSGTGLMADWEWAFGAALDWVRPFLRCTGEASLTFPCPGQPECDCRRHLIVETDRWGLVAACQCGECEQARWKIRPEERLMQGIDWRRFGGELRKALGFGEPCGPGMPEFGGLVEVGRYAGLASAYLSLADGDRLLGSVLRLLAAKTEPVVLLTPQGATCTPEVYEVLRREGGAHLALCDVVRVEEGGKMTGLGDAGDRLGRMLGANGRGVLTHTVEKIGQDLAAIARNDQELRRENGELKQMEAEGFFKFALHIDGKDFRAFAVIMALGNRKAAADFLKVPHRSFYDQVDRWLSRGKEYQRLYRFVEWRKKVGRKITVRLEDSLQSGEPNDEAENPVTVAEVTEKIAASDNRDYPGILLQVLEALRQQNPKNWAAVRGELMEMIREEVPQ